MALDNILIDDELRKALRAMHSVLEPSGRCYLCLRDFDHLFSVRPRYDFREERLVPYGRVIHLEDWIYEERAARDQCIDFFCERTPATTGIGGTR